MLKKAFIIILLISSVSFGQYWESRYRTPDVQNKRTLTDTKSLEEYYQNAFEKSSNSKIPLRPSFDIDKEKLLDQAKNLPPLEGPVDGENYIMGPGDIIQIDIWSDVPNSYPLVVNPEGTILVPKFGAIEVSGITLSKLKNIITEKLETKFKGWEITTTLISPRYFSVSVSGIVKNPGTYYTTSVSRVESVIYQSNLKSGIDQKKIDLEYAREKELINQPDYIKYFNVNEMNSFVENMSFRNIKIIRKNGEELNVDLVKYYATGDVAENPYMMEGDRVIVPNYSSDFNNLSISGAVLLEGTFEYNKNDSVLTMYKIAQGASQNADLQNAVLLRYDSKLNRYEKTIFNLEDIINNKSENFALLPNDRVIIPPKSDNKISYVEIKGSVTAPGIYPIISNSTSLTEIIKLAGGFTNDASLTESFILRNLNNLDKALDNPDYERLKNSRLSDMDAFDRQYFYYEAAIDRKYVSVDFNQLFMANDSTQNISLMDGDQIVIPEKKLTIYIYGQIVRPGYLNFEQGLTVDDYIMRAGGITVLGRPDDIRIVKAGSKDWLEVGDTKLEPGDAIWVPRERDTDLEYYFGWFSRIVAVLGGVATIILLLTK